VIGGRVAELGAPLLLTGDLSPDHGFHLGPTAAVRFELDCGRRAPLMVGATGALGVRVVPGFRIAVGLSAGTELRAIRRIDIREGAYAIAHLTFSSAQ
jgi:hypothetical protein